MKIQNKFESLTNDEISEESWRGIQCELTDDVILYNDIDRSYGKKFNIMNRSCKPEGNNSDVYPSGCTGNDFQDYSGVTGCDWLYLEWPKTNLN